ncbi:MAG: tetratricopeptide repeat protein [Terriglobia bacterium]
MRVEEAAATIALKPSRRRGALASASNSRLAPFAFLVLIVFLVYARSLSSSFVYDDQKQILDNPFVLNPHLWRHIFTGSVWSFVCAGCNANFYRPLMIFSYWILYRAFGPVPAFFHLFQVILFAAAACLVYAIGRELLREKTAALAAALLWAMHPQRVEAVAWIAALCDVGCGLLYLLAFFLFLRAERSSPGRIRTHAVAAGCFFVALLFKEMAISFPLLLLAYWFFNGKKDSWKSRALRFAPYLAALAAYVTIRRLALGHFLSATRPFQITGKLLASAAALLGQHTRLFFWPVHLSAFRTVNLHQGLHSPWLWLTALALLLALAFRKRAPLLSFLVFWWPVALLPCLDIRELSVPLLADRFTYIPAAGLCMAIALLALKALPRHAARHGVKGVRPAVAVGLATVIVFWTARTVYAIPRWRDNQTLVNYSSRQSPEDPSLHIVKGWDLQYRKNDLAGAAREFKLALSLNRTSLLPNSTVVYEADVSLGEVSLLQGHTDEAIDYLARAIHLSPAASEAYQFLGSVYFPRREYAQAAGYFARAVQYDPYETEARFYLATCWMKLGKYREAAREFRTARQVDPDDWQAYKAEARALAAEGESQQAAQVLKLLARRKRH